MQAMGEDLGKRFDGLETSTRKINDEYEAMKNEISKLKKLCDDLKKKQVNKNEDHSTQNNLIVKGMAETERKVWRSARTLFNY